MPKWKSKKSYTGPTCHACNQSEDWPAQKKCPRCAEKSHIFCRNCASLSQSDLKAKCQCVEYTVPKFTFDIKYSLLGNLQTDCVLCQLKISSFKDSQLPGLRDKLKSRLESEDCGKGQSTFCYTNLSCKGDKSRHTIVTHSCYNDVFVPSVLREGLSHFLISANPWIEYDKDSSKHSIASAGLAKAFGSSDSSAMSFTCYRLYNKNSCSDGQALHHAEQRAWYCSFITGLAIRKMAPTKPRCAKCLQHSKDKGYHLKVSDPS